VSHFSLIKIKIKNPNTALLKRAVELVAKELGGEVVSEVRDFYGRTMDCIVGLVNDTFRRGIGVRLGSAGEVELVGDFWGVPSSAVERFKRLLVQNYAALAMSAALASMGYQVQAQRMQERIYIRGVAP
jgi:hypothetical protein